jgi:hypothetical protein
MNDLLAELDDAEDAITGDDDDDDDTVELPDTSVELPDAE